MKGTKDLKTNKGITLIALVITIIVMLILVGVTISMAVNGGLFQKAGDAASRTNEAIKKEQELADLAAGITVDEMIEKYTQKEEKTITFAIGSENFEVKDGTTWGEWANSTNVATRANRLAEEETAWETWARTIALNPNEWSVAEDGRIAQGTSKFIGYNGVEVKSDEVIVDGRQYVKMIEFFIDEESYMADEGMTWMHWAESDSYKDLCPLVIVEPDCINGKFLTDLYYPTLELVLGTDLIQENTKYELHTEI